MLATLTSLLGLKRPAHEVVWTFSILKLLPLAGLAHEGPADLVIRRQVGVQVLTLAPHSLRHPAWPLLVCRGVRVPALGLGF